MRPLPFIRLFLLTASLAGCVGAGDSYVDGSLGAADAGMLAAEMTGFVKSALPAASSTVVLAPLPIGQEANVLTPTLVGNLREAGFAVAAAADAAPTARRIRYVVTPFEGGTVVRLSVGETQASRYFIRDADGRLQAGGPFMVRDAAS